jgi:Trk-type K+ transport system membrane component
MRTRRFSTSMGIAFTLLTAGAVVQVTDQLEFFGKDSVIPLIIGLIIIVVGIPFVFLLRCILQTKEP